ncbi:hypothetical protein CJ030_MR0G005123 [Morella rubra]|uniref:Uncharacterized protein n=1 Tax=Morella rubra TaxID=262757 RepID=A0A6A1UMS8_9ROSI|nr:hypothetical protein CJ030_MR0G005123 [Morella rubra]
MMNSKLPIYTRTRRKTDLFFKKYNEEIKKKKVRKDSDGVDSSCMKMNESERPEGDEGIFCIDVDDENGLSGEDVDDIDELISSLKRNVESNCSNFDDSSSSVDCRSQSRSGFLKKNENEDDCDYGASNDSDGLKRIDNGDGDENVVSDRLRRNEDGGVDAGSGNLDSLETSLELSSSEEDNEDEDYEAENLESYIDFEQLSDSEKEEDDEESEGVEKGSRKSKRPKRVGTGSRGENMVWICWLIQMMAKMVLLMVIKDIIPLHKEPVLILLQNWERGKGIWEHSATHYVLMTLVMRLIMLRRKICLVEENLRVTKEKLRNGCIRHI